MFPCYNLKVEFLPDHEIMAAISSSDDDMPEYCIFREY
jgi:hypothetical protein